MSFLIKKKENLKDSIKKIMKKYPDRVPVYVLSKR